MATNVSLKQPNATLPPPKNIQQRADQVKNENEKKNIEICALYSELFSFFIDEDLDSDRKTKKKMFKKSILYIFSLLHHRCRRRRIIFSLLFCCWVRVKKFLWTDFKHDLLKNWNNKWGDTLIYCSKFTLSIWTTKNVWCLQKYKLKW